MVQELSVGQGIGNSFETPREEMPPVDGSELETVATELQITLCLHKKMQK